MCINSPKVSTLVIVRSEIMKKSGMLFGAMLGMGAGAFLYSYAQKHPIKMEMAKNKVKNFIEDLK